MGPVERWPYEEERDRGTGANLVALWKYVTGGVVIEGFVLKASREQLSRSPQPRQIAISRPDHQSWQIQVNDPKLDRARMPLNKEWDRSPEPGPRRKRDHGVVDQRAVCEVEPAMETTRS